LTSGFTGWIGKSSTSSALTILVGGITVYDSSSLAHDLALNSILAEEKSPEMLERLQAWGVLAMIHPALGWDHKMRRRFLHRDDPPSEEWGTLPNNTRLPRRIALGYLLWLMHLSSEQLRALDRRLHFSAALRDSLQEASALRRDLPDLKRGKPSQIHARLVGVPLLVVYAVSLSADAPGRQVLNAFGMRWRHIKPRTTGLDLMARGVPAGPAYQEILKTLRTAWLDGGVNTPEEELALLDQLVRSSAQGEKRIGDR
jgi:tRNA nucleotidyltransferase/poly(A) polymerase